MRVIETNILLVNGDSFLSVHNTIILCCVAGGPVCVRVPRWVYCSEGPPGALPLTHRLQGCTQDQVQRCHQGLYQLVDDAPHVSAAFTKAAFIGSQLRSAIGQ